jgi:hypothetical protein
VKVLEVYFVAMSFFLLIRAAYTSGRNLANRAKNILVATLLFVFLIIATKAMFFVSASSGFHHYRYNYALPFFYAFCFYFIFQLAPRALASSVSLAVGFVLIISFGQFDLMRQGILVRAQQHDLAIANRILYRIESLPNLNYDKEYYLVRTGKYSKFKSDSLRRNNDFDVGGDSHMDNGEFSALWTPASAMSLLGSRIKWKGVGYMPNFDEMIAEAKDLAEKQGRKPWPHPSSVFMHNDWIIVYM